MIRPWLDANGFPGAILKRPVLNPASSRAIWIFDFQPPAAFIGEIFSLGDDPLAAELAGVGVNQMTLAFDVLVVLNATGSDMQ